MSNEQTKVQKYFSDIEKWESRELGGSEEFSRASSMSKQLKEALNGGSDADANSSMQLISMRLPTALIDDLKKIGKEEGLGYQTLAREVLTRFVEAENRKLVNKLLSEVQQMEEELDTLREEKKKEKKSEKKSA